MFESPAVRYLTGFVFVFLITMVGVMSCSQTVPQLNVPAESTAESAPLSRPEMPGVQKQFKKKYLLIQKRSNLKRNLAEALSNNLVEASTETPAKVVKPYRTFITIQRYFVEQNGENPEREPISNIKLVVQFPHEDPEKEGPKVELPGDGQYWPIGNGQVQEIDRSFELPFRHIENDGFKFKIQMVRKGSWMKPCEFDVIQLSEFDRKYICRTDEEWQRKRGIPEDRLDREGVQIRVSTDLHQPKRKYPKNAIAIR